MTLTAAAFVAWAIVGWCGTPWRPHWPGPPPPGPGPDPWLVKVLGVIGGVAGGWTFGLLFNADVTNSASLVVTFVGAVAGSVVVNDIYGLVPRGRAKG